MRYRCLNPTNPKYRFYGGRGISICARWESFDNFLADMGPRPAGKTLDRYPDQNGNYEPGNCRWATKAEQVANMRPRSALLVPRVPPSMLGLTFGRLTIVSYAGIRARRAYWNCRCECSAVVAVSSNALRMGRTRSCGCLRREVAALNCPPILALMRQVTP